MRAFAQRAWLPLKPPKAVVPLYWDLPIRARVLYSDAGVHIAEANRAAVPTAEAARPGGAIRKLARGPFTPGVLTEIGSFGASFQLGGLRRPVLVSSADGVGTKLKVAFATGRHDTVGEDLVNHCVNDIA